MVGADIVIRSVNNSNDQATRRAISVPSSLLEYLPMSLHLRHRCARSMASPGTLVRFVLVCATLLLLPHVGIGQNQPDRDSLNGRLGRPGPADQPFGISVGAYLIDVIDIDDVESTFTVDFLVDLQWKDPLLADPASKELRRLTLDDAWHPELAFVNERNVTPKLESYLIVDADGNVSYKQRFFGTFSVALKLADFPFDEQSLAIDMVILRYRSDEIVCSRNESLIGCEPDLELPGWHFQGFSVTTGVKKIGIAGYDLSASFLQADVRRDRWYYMWKIVFPLVLIVMMSSAVFWIPPTLIPSQIGISTASVLTLIAFYLTIASSLPRISYLTRLDTFVIGSTSMVFMAFGQAVWTGRLAHAERIELAQKVDRWTRVVFFVGYASFGAFALAF
jgi:hypothetical protein